MTSRGNTRLKVWLLLLGVFVLGCATGAAFDSAYRLRAGGGRPEARGVRHGGRENVFDDLKRDLDLNDQQATEIRAILEQARNDYRSLRAEARPRYDAIRQNARTRIRALLTPEQQQRFDAHVAKHDAQRDDGDRDER
jgi:Spy/CpxP family protein refolding chaperone